MSLNSLDLSYNHFGELGGIRLAAGLVSRLYIYIKTSVFGACIGCFFDQEQTFVVNKTLRVQVCQCLSVYVRFGINNINLKYVKLPGV